MSPKILGGSWYTATDGRMRLNPPPNEFHPAETSTILGFRTVRNAREPRHNIRDQKLLDLTGFVNAVFPGSSIAELTKFPMMVNLGNIKNVRVLTHDTMVLDMESTPASGVHPVYSDHYVREVQFAQYVQGIMGHKADAVIVDDPYTATWDTNYKVGA